MKFRPLHDRVVIRRVDEETKTAGGIIIPDSAQEKPQEGEVVAVGLVLVAMMVKFTHSMLMLEIECFSVNGLATKSPLMVKSYSS